MLINEVYNDVLLFSNKSQIGGFIGVNDFNSYADFAQMDIMDELHDMLDYNMRSSILLSDILKTANVSVINGVVQTPTDYYKYADSNALFSENGEIQPYPVDFISKSERGERKRSKIVDPTTDYPIATEGFSGLLIDPTNVTLLELTYIFRPVKPIWAGTATVPPVFDPNTSTDFVLSDKFKTILTYKICSYFSVEIRDGELNAATTKQLIQQM